MTQQYHIFLVELKQAFRIVWYIISLIGLVILFAALFMKHDLVLSITPTCASIKYFNKECILCGMSRAFLEIRDLRFFEAYQLNRGSIFLFLFFCANSIIFITFNLINTIRYLKKFQFYKSIFKLKF